MNEMHPFYIISARSSHSRQPPPSISIPVFFRVAVSSSFSKSIFSSMVFFCYWGINVSKGLLFFLAVCPCDFSTARSSIWDVNTSIVFWEDSLSFSSLFDFIINSHLVYFVIQFCFFPREISVILWNFAFSWLVSSMILSCVVFCTVKENSKLVWWSAASRSKMWRPCVKAPYCIIYALLLTPSFTVGTESPSFGTVEYY